MNASAQTRRVLAALACQSQSWRHGYDLLKQTGLASGTLYPLLIRLSDQGLLESEWRPSTVLGRPPRHVYRLTGAGRAFAVAQAQPEPLEGAALDGVSA